MGTLADLTRTFGAEMFSDQALAEKLLPLLAYLQNNFAVIRDAFANGLTFTDNLNCEVVSARFSHGVAQRVKLQKLTKATCAVLLGADGCVPWGSPLVVNAAPSQVNITIWFNDPAVTGKTVNLLLLNVGSSLITQPTFNDPILKSLLTTAGDTIYASAPSTPARLAAPADGSYAVNFASGVPSYGTLGASGGGSGSKYGPGAGYYMDPVGMPWGAWIAQAQTTTLAQIGPTTGAPAFTSPGAAATQVEIGAGTVFTPAIHCSTAATTGSACGILASPSFGHEQLRRRYFFHAVFPSASLTNARVWRGITGTDLSGTAGPTSSAVSAIKYAAFFFDTGVSASHIYIASGDGSHHSGTDTGVTIASGDTLWLIIDWSVANQITWSVQKFSGSLQAAVTGVKVSNVVVAPESSTILKLQHSTTALANATKDDYFLRAAFDQLTYQV